MFNAFPKHRDDWLKLLLFPFQAFAVTAHLMSYYLVFHWPHRGFIGPLNHFYDQIAPGYALCFLVLLIVGIRQMVAGRRMSAIANILLAAWCAFSFATPGWIQA